MIKYIAAVLCLLAVAESRVVPSQVSIRSNPFGVVEGLRPCVPPGVGQIIQVRVTDCTLVPCHLVTGRVYTVEIDFVPRDSHPLLHLRVLLTHDGEEHLVMSGDVENSGVEAGNRYTFTYPITVEGFFLGDSDLRIEISGASNRIIELCGIAPIRVT